MMYATIVAFLFIVIKANGIKILVSDSDNDKSLSGLGAFSLHHNFLKFQVKGCRDCHVFLKSKPLSYREVPYYKIMIGAWGNSRSRLDKWILENTANDGFQIHDAIDFVAMDCDHYKDFWITWDRGKILVGRGNILNTDIFLSFNEPCPFKIQDIEASVWESTNTWLIDTAQFLQDPVVSTKRKRVAQVKAIACPTYRVLRTVTGASLVECVALCLFNAECSSIKIDNITKTCMHESNIVDTVDESVHHKIIIRQ